MNGLHPSLVERPRRLPLGIRGTLLLLAAAVAAVATWAAVGYSQSPQVPANAPASPARTVETATDGTFSVMISVPPTTPHAGSSPRS